MNELLRRLQYLLHRRRFDRELANDLEFHREMAESAGRAAGPPAAASRTGARRVGLDLDRPLCAGSALRGPHAAQVAWLHAGGGADAGYRHRRQRGRLRLLRPDGLAALKCSRSSHAAAIPSPRAPELCVRHALSGNGVLSRARHAPCRPCWLSIPPAWLSKARTSKWRPASSPPISSANWAPRRGSADCSIPRGTRPRMRIPVVVLDEGFWQRHFGADASVIGRTIRLNGKPATIVGVAPRDFSGLRLNESASVPAHHPTTLFSTRQPTADRFHRSAACGCGAGCGRGWHPKRPKKN